MFFKRNKNQTNRNDLPLDAQQETTRIMAQVAEDYIKDRNSRRRWGFVFKAFIAVYLIVVLATAWYSPATMDISEPHTALVTVEGVIGGNSLMTAGRVNAALRRAFEAKYSKGVIVAINSPGGTPVQADRINAEITRLKHVYGDKPVYAVVGDLCASGGYYVAVAADEIYANPSSIVGSIGVRMGGFGFVDTMEKLGVERRLITAGDNKGMLDPFSPVNEAQIQHAKNMIGDVHQQFVDVVKQGRGERLADDPELFSGLVWSGVAAKQLGLIDHFGDVASVAREQVGAKRVVDYSLRPGLLDQVTERLGASIASQIWTRLSAPVLQ